MAAVNLGRVGLVLKGDWSGATTYTALDIVSQDGNSWAAKRGNTNVEPTTENTDDWQLISNNSTLVATVQGYKEDAEAAATTATTYGNAVVSAVAPVEASSTASQAYAAGDFFIYNGTLYIASASIAQGGTITPNTNCTAIPKGISSEVTSLKSALAKKAPKTPIITELSPTLTVGIVNYNTLEVYKTSDTYTGRYTTISVTAGEEYLITGKGIGSGANYYPAAFVVYDGGKDLLLSEAQYYTDEPVQIVHSGTLYVNGVVDAGVLKLYIKSVVYQTDADYISMMDNIPKHGKYLIKKEGTKLKIKRKQGNKDIMIVLDNVGGNSLYNFDYIYVYSNNGNYISDDFSETSDDIIYTKRCSVSDWIGPYKLTADNNADGDTPSNNYFTGGFHRTTNTATGGGITGSQRSFSVFVDGVAPVDNVVMSCNEVVVTWKNGINAYNTSKANGTGRDVITETWTLRFADKVYAHNVITALEGCHIVIYYGLQMTTDTGDTIRIVSGNDRGAYANTDTGNSGNMTARTVEATNANIRFGFHIGDEDLGLFNSNNAGYSITKANGKVYAVLVSAKHLILNANDTAYLDGYYDFQID